MNSTQIIGLIIGILILLGILFFLVYKKGRVNTTETFEHYPFTINKRNTYSSRYDYNTNSRRDDSRSYYKVFYKDQLIEFPSALNEDTGVYGLWKAYILKNASRPALLAASKSIYLIQEENNNYKLTAISEKGSDFVSIQWLDSDEGQPGSKQEIYSSDDTDKSCDLQGGNFLLINKNIVLDVKNLAVYPFQVGFDLTDNYHSNQVVAFSPDKQQIAYMGSHRERDKDFALNVYNFKNNEAYTVPFERSEARLHEPYTIHSGWFNSFFVWNQNEDGNHILEKRMLDTPPNWKGHFSGKGYSVSPAKKEMLDIFSQFLKDKSTLQGQDIIVKDGYSDTNFDVSVGQHRIGLSYFDDLQSVYFSVHFATENEEECFEMIKLLGNAFNEKLDQGQYQDLFTAY